MRVTTRKDDDILEASEESEAPSSHASMRSLTEPGFTSSPEISVDEQRAADLDALADVILSRKNEPKTLLGLGVIPEPLESEPDNEETRVLVRRAPVASAPSAPIEQAALEGAQQPPLQAAQFEAEPLPFALAATVSYALPSSPLVEGVRAEFATITPPPGDDEAGPFKLNEWLDENREDVIPAPELTQPRQASVRPVEDECRGVDSFGPQTNSVRTEAPWVLSPNRRSQPAIGLRLGLIGLAFAASLAATVALVNSLLPARKGTLLITASGPSQLRIEQAQVLFDGKTVCSQVPCRLEALPPGIHGVSVWAKGYERMAAQPFQIRGGVESALQLTLTRRDTAALRVNVNVPGLSVRIDGEDRGTAPTTIHQLSPAEHTLRLAGNAAYVPFEQRVTLEADQVLTIEPKLVPLVGKLHLEAGRGADGAQVEVIRDGNAREVGKLPVDLEITPGASYRVHASKRFYEDYDVELAFDEAHPEQSLAIALRPREAAAAGPTPVGPVPAPLTQPPAFVASAALPEHANANGMLNINSIPISRIFLDGRAIGSTPQKLTLGAGPHALTFVHPTLGRQSLNVNVSAGQTAVAAVRF